MRTLGVGGLVAALAAAAGVIIALAVLAAQFGDEEVEVAEVEKLVAQIAGESAAVTSEYFGDAEAAAQGLVAMVGRDAGASRSDGLASDLALFVRSHDQIEGLYVGFPDGAFLDVRKVREHDDLVFKEILIDGDVRTVASGFVDGSGEVGPVTAVEGDDYDPRVRPWYVQVVDEDVDQAWTDPYIFFTSGAPGITHSIPVRDVDGMLRAVVGVDISLENLSAFLAGRRPSANGRAVVVTSDGQRIAGPSPTSNPVDSSGGSVAVALRPVTGSGSWSLVVEAPHSDFLNELRSERQRSSVFAVGLALLLAILVIGSLSATARHINELRERATTDSLTGLLNRQAILRVLRKGLDRRRSQFVGLLIIDLNDFKLINDSFGHAAGDAALVALAGTIQGFEGPDTHIGRLGGDEFVIVFATGSATGQREFEALCRAVVDGARADVAATESSQRVTVSCGATTKRPSESKTVTAMFREADTALYVAKGSGEGNRVEHYESQMVSPQLRAKLRTVELADAIANDEFEWHFQPEVDLRTGAIVGAEALIRWRHPERGLIGAEEFIDDIERLGLISRLARPMVRRAEQLLERVEGRPFAMRLNIAGEQVRSVELLKLLSEATARFPEVTFCLELTERSVLSASHETVDALEALRALDVEIDLDDFGTGYSSLRDLDRLPVDGIKLDRSFVRAIDSEEAGASIASVVIDIGRVLDLVVVAEGVETLEQRDALVDLGCGRGQGFLYAEPLSPVDFPVGVGATLEPEVILSPPSPLATET